MMDVPCPQLVRLFPAIWQRKQRINLSGRQFGRLKVLFDCGQDMNGTAMYLCTCNCGQLALVRVSALTTGAIRGCGCGRQLPKGEARFNQIYEGYKRKALKFNLVFELTKEYARQLMGQTCFYCGDAPGNVSKGRRANGSFVYSGIDRVDNSKGYIVDNCVPCCGVCNWMKNRLSATDFLQHVNKIYKRVVSSIM